MCRGVIKCAAAAAAASHLGNYQVAKGRDGEVTDCCGSLPPCTGASLIESLLSVPEDGAVARVPIPQKLKRFPAPDCPQSAIGDCSAQDPKRRKLVAKAGPFKAGPEEPATTIGNQQIEEAAVPIILEDTCQDVSAVNSNIDFIDSPADLLSSVGSAHSISFPLTPEPEWQRILDDLETELNEFNPSSSPPPPTQPQENEKDEMPLLTQLLKSQGPVRDEYAKIESDPDKPPTPQCPHTPPQEEFDSGFTSPVCAMQGGGSPVCLSPPFRTPLSPEDFNPSAFPFDPQEPTPMPLSYHAHFSTSAMQPPDTFEFAYPPVNTTGQEWLFQFAAEPWERQVFSAPKRYPECQPPVPMDNTAEFFPTVAKEDIGSYLLL